MGNGPGTSQHAENVAVVCHIQTEQEYSCQIQRKLQFPQLQKVAIYHQSIIYLPTYLSSIYLPIMHLYISNIHTIYVMIIYLSVCLSSIIYLSHVPDLSSQ